ncbi:glycoside hydrolase family 19 protein [Salipiger sp.]|uniref:glycoside hydrolase family 19 protein n=1 Tax=Salipiger sp. TaxID=2078585 RepID=UPI003A96BF68
MRSVLAGLAARGHGAGLGRPWRLAHYVAQLGHESGGFRYDREIWGPTPAQERYDTRTDLGNTAARDGDGFKYRGRTGIQITGAYNVGAFSDWCRAEIDPAAPDFRAAPDLMNTDPWEGLGPIWYWETRGLNRYADAGDIENLTRAINGGLNGYSDRIARYTRAALVLLGFGPDDVRAFQEMAGVEVDGLSGPITRGALHQFLCRLAPVDFGGSAGAAADPISAEAVADDLRAELAEVKLGIDATLAHLADLSEKIEGVLAADDAGGPAPFSEH